MTLKKDVSKKEEGGKKYKFGLFQGGNENSTLDAVYGLLSTVVLLSFPC